MLTPDFLAGMASSASYLIAGLLILAVCLDRHPSPLNLWVGSSALRTVIVLMLWPVAVCLDGIARLRMSRTHSEG